MQSVYTQRELRSREREEERLKGRTKDGCNPRADYLFYGRGILSLETARAFCSGLITQIPIERSVLDSMLEDSKDSVRRDL